MIEPRINARKIIIYTWKFFGDGIANIYQPTCNLKHLYYDSDYKVKEDAGFISGKKGFKQEWKMFTLGLKHKVPVVLSDITNVIRHGDVCALGFNDPIPIEVKRKIHDSPGKRVNRQIKQLEQLALFFENDYAPNFRNGVDTYRIETQGQDIAYIDEINLLVRKALKDGYSSSEVEHGLTYFCTRTIMEEELHSSAMKHFEDIGAFCNTVMVHELTPEESWGVAYPFTLSLENECLVAFIQNEIVIYIVTDLEEVRREFLTHNVYAKFIMDGLSAIQISLDESDVMKGTYRISEQCFDREVIGFNSVKAFIDGSCSLLKGLPDLILNNCDMSEQVIFNESLLDEWRKAKDILIEARQEN